MFFAQDTDQEFEADQSMTDVVDTDDEIDISARINNSSKAIYVYTDGSCINNGKANAKAGIGIYFGENDSRNVSRKFKGKQSNNTAELTALIDVSKILKKDINNNQ